MNCSALDLEKLISEKDLDADLFEAAMAAGVHKLGEPWARFLEKIYKDAIPTKFSGEKIVRPKWHDAVLARRLARCRNTS